jgi:lysozyme
MKLSDKGLLEICEHEGIVPAPYLDSVGTWTFGVGHTRAAGGPDPAKMQMGMPTDLDTAIDYALAVFREDIKKYEQRVNDAIKVPLEQHEFDALVSFDFNTGGIYRAKLTQAINRGDDKAFEHFMGWLKPPEIKKRRKDEMSLFVTGDYKANGDLIPVWRVDTRGKLQGVMKTISGTEVLKRMSRPSNPSPSASTGLLVSLIEIIKNILSTFKRT